ncbi:MAG: cytochrome c [Thiovulaceae bacterium]|nr:cytochrome c [Sulfurimonadaceae bacterium]
MKNIFLSITILLAAQNLYAYSSKGMKVYKKMCLSCHGSPYRGAKMHTIDEWEEIYEASKTPIKHLHKSDAEALKILDADYFTKKKQSYLKDFLIGNAKDAGSVPGCDGNYCGS